MTLARFPLVIPLAVLATPAPSASQTSVVGVPTYDRRLEAIVVPVMGDPPEVRTSVTERPGVEVVSLAGRAAFSGRRGAYTPGHPALSAWTATVEGGRVRVSLRFRARRVPVAIDWDKQRHALVLTPLYPGKAMPRHGVPLAGPPRPTVLPERPHAAATPTIAPTPAPTPRPVSPAPSAGPTPPAPMPRLSPLPWEREGAVSLRYHSVDYDEVNPAGDLLVQVRAARMLGAGYGVRFAPEEPWRSRLTPEGWSPYWRADVSAYSFSYVVSDRHLPFSYRFREDSRLEASLMRELSREHVWTDVGLGYFARLEDDYNTGVPPDLSQAFTYQRFFQAPMARFSVSVPPEEVVIGGLRGWRLFAELDVAPRVFTAVDKGLPGLPTLGWNRWRAGIERDWGPFRLTISDSLWTMSGANFDERLHAPGLTLSWTTRWP